MLIQGGILSYLYASLPGTGRSIAHALKFAWLAGGFLVSYIAWPRPQSMLFPRSPVGSPSSSRRASYSFTAYGLLLAAVYRLKASSP